MSHWSLLFDGVIAVLLVATIGYAMVLNRKLSALRSAKDELASLLRSFAEATAKADAGLEAIRRTAESSGKDLQAQVTQANALMTQASALTEDLRFLIQRAGLSADKVEANIAKGREGAAAKAEPGPARQRPVSGAMKAMAQLGRTQEAPRPSFGGPAAKRPVDQGPQAARPQPQARPKQAEPQVSAEQVALIKALDGVR